MIPQVHERTAVFADPGLDAAFDRDGYVVVSLLDTPMLTELRSAYARLRQEARTGFSSTILERDAVHRRQVHDAVRRVLGDACRRLLVDRCPALCTFVTKAAGMPDGEVPLHQDWSFFDESAGSPVGAWCPLVDVTSANGCLQVVTGSHRVSSAPRPVRAPFAFPALEARVRRHGLVPVPMRAGEAMIFDQRLFHASGANGGPADRVAATAVLTPASAGLRYYHASDPVAAPWLVEVFAVDADFYVRHRTGRRPDAATLLGVVDLRTFSTDASAIRA
jgi:ectoine hydroxylase-related dioxygenase (phytanoyl-CoA dioxygenase family)